MRKRKAKKLTVEQLTMLVRLTPLRHTGSARMLPISVIQLGIRRRLGLDAQTQERSKRIEGVEAPVESKRELVEVRLQVIGRDTVKRAVDPRLQVAEYQVNDRQVVLGNARLAALGNCEVLVTSTRETRVALTRVGDHHLGERVDVGGNETSARLRCLVRDHREAQPTRVAPATLRLSLVVSVVVDRVDLLDLARLDLDRADHAYLIGDAAPLAARPAAHQRLVDFHGGARADRTGRADHGTTELVEDLKCRLVAGQSELALELRRAHAGREARHEKRGPEPRTQRGVRALHDGAGRERDISLAALAAQDTRLGDSCRGGGRLATRTHEPLAPAHRLQVESTRSVVGKHTLKCGNDSGKVSASPATIA